MDRLELARRLFGDGVEGTSTFHPAETQTYIGKAVSDSADGLVRVDIGNSTTEDGEEGIEVATTVSVKEGEEVYVTAVGGTVAKSYYVSGVVGLGDETNSRITAIETDYVKATMLEADLAEIGVLTADSAVISELQAETAKVENVTAAQLEASTAYIGALQTGNVTAQNIIADKAKLAQIDTAQITADHAVINALDSNYAKIDLANVSNAWIDDGVIRDAAIGDAQIADISANKLTAGTINGSVINVTNLNATNITTGTINGQRLGEGSISLSKLSESVYTEGEVDSIVSNLNDRIDSAIETYTATAVPTLSNYPASSWDTDDEKAEHVGDICYVLNAGSETDGYTYRFAYDNSTSTYQWVLIKDNQVTAALQRLVDAEGDIDGLQSFQSDTSVWISDTDEALNVIRNNHTSLTTVVNKTIVETVQLWYSKANTTAPAKPTSQVTSTLTSGGAWRTVVPSYSTSYPNYFYCYQWKYADGTYGWSSVTRDIAMGEAQSTSRTAASDAASAATTANSNIKSNVQLWYTKQTSTAPSKPSAHVTTNNAGTANAWNLAVPTYNATYPHYFYCYEYQLGNGTYGWTNVVYDSAMTESQERARTAVSNAATAQTTAEGAATAASNAQATANSNIKSSVQLWYSKDNETAPSKPTAQVTSTSTSGGGWRTVVPTYSSSYPYYYYCYQYQMGDGTYKWSDVVYDRATTESQSTARATASSLSNYITTNDGALAALKSQVDGQLEVWYGNADPTASNLPASGWDSDQKTAHSGDLYYNVSDGTVWQWSGSSWTELPDDAAAAALNAAHDAQATADGKRRIFTATPTVPYDIGDLWVNGSEVKYATVKKTESQSYAASDWSLTATDDTAANAAQATADKNVKTSVQLWYTKANEEAPAKPSAKVTSNSTSGGGWRIVVPSYNASYPKYFYCYQYELADGTYTWSDVVFDRATTENEANAHSALTQLTTKVDTQTFNDLSDTVSEHTRNITTLTTTTQQMTQKVEFIEGDYKPNIYHTTDGTSGTNGIFHLATITVNDAYASQAIAMTCMHRNSSKTEILIAFNNVNGTDPGIKFVRYTGSMVVYMDRESAGVYRLWVTKAESYDSLSVTEFEYGSYMSARISWEWTKDQVSSVEDLNEGYVTGQQLADGQLSSNFATSSQLTIVSNTVNTVSQTADSNLQKISNLTTTLGTNADGTTNVNDIVHRESALEQDLDGFRATVSETYSTKTDTATAKSEAINAANTYTDNAIDDIEIGGRNLLLWSGDANHSPVTRWNSQNNVTSMSYDSTYDAFKYVTPSDAGNQNNGMGINTNSDGWMNSYGRSQIVNGSSYVFSIDVMGTLSSGNPMTMKIFYSSSTGDWNSTPSQSVNVTGKVKSDSFTRVSVNFTLPSTRTEGTRIVLSLGAKGATFYVKNPKLELGNKPTDWTPAPEDMATGAEVSAIETRVSTNETSIEQNKTDIALKANSSDVYTKSATDGLISTEVTNRNAAIQTATDGIRSEVSETYATKTEVRRTDSGSGTFITSDDAANLPLLSLTVHGKSVQDGTPSPSSPVEIQSVEGRNLSPFFSHDITDVYSASTNPNGYWFWFSTEATWTQKDDGWVHVEYSNTGSSAVYPNCIVQQVPALKNGASYTFLVEIANATINGDVKFSPNGSAGSTVAYLNNVTAFSIANNSTYYKSITAKSDFSGCNRFACSYFNVPAGGSISLDLRISIYEGGYAGAYQPYQSITAAITGKNLLDLARAAGGTSHGITVTPNGDGTFGLVGTATSSDVNVWLAGTYNASAPTLFTLPAGTYTVTDCALFKGTSRVFHAEIGSSQTVTLTAATPITGIRAPSAVNGKTYDTTIKPQLEYSSDASDYAPYTDASAFIPLQDHALRSLPDGTDDTLEVDGEGNVTLTQRVGSYTITGSESIQASAALGSHYRVQLRVLDSQLAKTYDDNGGQGSTNGYCSAAPFYAHYSQQSVHAYTDGRSIFIFAQASTAADALAAFAGATAYYPLATPQTISLGKIDLPSLPSPSFSMHVDASVTPNIDAEWWTQGGEEVGSVYQRTSELEQDAHGFTLRMDGIDGDLSDLSGDLSDLSGDLSDLSKDAVLKSKDTWTAWMDVGTDSNNDPYLTMGQSGNAFESRLTNRYMSFNEGTVELMRLSGEDGVRADTIRSKYVYIGSWILEQLDNGDMAIKLVGQSSS